MDSQETEILIATLTQLVSALNKPRLGFHSDAGTTRVYCNRSNGCLWYTLKDGDTPVEIQHTALTGYLRELKFERVQRRGKEVCKLLITIDADGKYLLESGHDAHFSKCVLSAIALLTLQEASKPITISVSPGDEDSVLFARIYAGNEYIKASYGEDTNFREISKRAIAVVKAANN